MHRWLIRLIPPGPNDVPKIDPGVPLFRLLGQKRSIDRGDRFSPLDTGRVRFWHYVEPSSMYSCSTASTKNRPSSNDLFGIPLNWLPWPKICAFVEDPHGSLHELDWKQGPASKFTNFHIWAPRSFLHGWLHHFLCPVFLPRWPCADIVFTFSFTCRPCPHRGRGRETHFSAKRSFLPSGATWYYELHAMQTRKDRIFYKYFSSQS